MNSVFLQGEKIDLCAPQEDDFPQWAGWMNDPSVTRWLASGNYPSTPETQRDYFRREIQAGRLIVMIKDKSGKLLGQISLSRIDHASGSAQISYLCPEKSERARLAPLEAIARLSQHAIEALGMRRVWSGSAWPGLANWVPKKEIIGFFPEGLHVGQFVKGTTSSDSLPCALTAQTFAALAELRNGNLWPGESMARKLLARRKESPSMAAQLAETVERLHGERLAELLQSQREIGE